MRILLNKKGKAFCPSFVCLDCMSGLRMGDFQRFRKREAMSISSGKIISMHGYDSSAFLDKPHWTEWETAAQLPLNIK